MKIQKQLLISFLFACSVSFSQAATIIDVSLDRRIDDIGGDGSGNSVEATSASRHVGDSSNNSRVFATVWSFDISSFESEIAAGTQIDFDVSVLSVGGDPSDAFGSFEFVGLTGNADGSFATTDFQAAGTSLGSFDLTGVSSSSIVSFDVTSFVQAETANFVRFRLWAGPGSGINNGNSVADIVTFGTGNAQALSDATLTVIPEPSSILLVALGLAATLVLRRSRT